MTMQRCMKIELTEPGEIPVLSTTEAACSGIHIQMFFFVFRFFMQLTRAVTSSDLLSVVCRRRCCCFIQPISRNQLITDFYRIRDENHSFSDITLFQRRGGGIAKLMCSEIKTVRLLKQLGIKHHLVRGTQIC